MPQATARIKRNSMLSVLRVEKCLFVVKCRSLGSQLPIAESTPFVGSCRRGNGVLRRERGVTMLQRHRRKSMAKSGITQVRKGQCRGGVCTGDEALDDVVDTCGVAIS